MYTVCVCDVATCEHTVELWQKLGLPAGSNRICSLVPGSAVKFICRQVFNFSLSQITPESGVKSLRHIARLS